MKNNKYWLLTPYSYIQLGLLLLLLGRPDVSDTMTVPKIIELIILLKM